VSIEPSTRQALLIAVATGAKLADTAAVRLLELPKPRCVVCQNEGCEFCPSVERNRHAND
jgi:hypothetical protein